jgi:hypothetical protein
MPRKPARYRIFTAAYIRSIVSYDQETGEVLWTWSDDPSDPTAPRHEVPAHFQGKDGRQFILVMGYPIPVQYVAWIYMTGEWPIKTVDHKDCDPSNNRWKNLREATRSQQLYNTRKRRILIAASKIKGVWFDKARGKWSSQICIDGKRYHLGRFDREEDAAKAYRGAALRLHGDFARIG